MSKRKTVLSFVCFGTLAVLAACGGTKNSSMGGENKALNAKINYGFLRDSRDGHVYRTVQIGNQVWMAENLNYETDESYCRGDDDSNCDKYGRLYSWSVAIESCPEGWRLPDAADWEKLFAKVDGRTSGGKVLKSLNGWLSQGNGTDDFGFSAVPAGIRFENGDYNAGRDYAFFWSSMESDAENAYGMNLSYFSDRSDLSAESKKNGFSVRCIRGVGRLAHQPRRENDVTLNSANLSSWTPDGGIGSMTDARDGQTYRIVKIGSQTWMAENLNFKTENSYCYKDDDSNCTKYGRLYTWAAAMDSAGVFSTNGMNCGYALHDRDVCKPSFPVRGVCPLGWHLPTFEEWEELFVTTGENREMHGHYTMAGKRLKAKTGWPVSDKTVKMDYVSLESGYFTDKKYDEPISVMGSDDYGFSVLPAGYKESAWGYKLQSERAMFWTSTQSNSSFVKDIFFKPDETTAFNSVSRIEYSLSVRCVKD